MNAIRTPPATDSAGPPRVLSAAHPPLAPRALGTILAPAIALALLVALLRALYMLFFSPYELAEDEAFYTLWSQHPAWSYNTKGPGIAWAIWLCSHTFGLTEFGIRMLSVISAAITAIAVAAMAALACGDLPARTARRASLIASALCCLIPAFQATALLATIDAPYLACWAIAGTGAMLIATRSGRRADGTSRAAALGWVMLGLGVGVGFLFKYTILLILPGIAAWLWRHRADLPTPAGGRWRAASAGVLLAVLGLLPVAVWNAQNDWATVRHLLGHVNIGLAPAADPAAVRAAENQPLVNFPGVGEFVGAQLAIIGPAMALMAIGTLAIAGTRARMCTLLAWISMPILLFYLIVSLRTPGEGNWPIAGYIGLLPLAGLWVATRADRDARPTARVRGAFFLWHATIIFGVITGLATLRLDLVRSGLESVGSPLARRVPIGRLIGGREMALHAAELREQLAKETGLVPMFIAQHYGRGSQVEFYLPGTIARADRRVYIAQSRLGGRVVQQDYWPDYDLSQSTLLGRPAVIIADDPSLERWAASFERVELVGELRGGTRGSRFGLLGWGYKGIARPDGPRAF